MTLGKKHEAQAGLPPVQNQYRSSDKVRAVTRVSNAGGREAAPETRQRRLPFHGKTSRNA